jgi:ectoine hydroxylase-related dioxygenase (phytanoyl-CoA dioxygenase family)
MTDEALLEAFFELGYAIAPRILDEAQITELQKATEFDNAGSTHARDGRPYANRAALSIQAIADLSRSEQVLAVVSQVLPDKPFAVRAILFDKVVGANWKIPWHQDITIPVKERHEVDGYGPWSIKEGSPHTQAPTRVLQNMVAIRLHLDDCLAENGPLRVVPRSHLTGRMRKADIPLLEPTRNSKDLICKRGDAILMSPLTVHASSPATSPSHRRVIHIEYACCDLDNPLEWARRV